MKHEFTATVEQDQGWFVAYSPEVPGANGQGRTRDEAIASLAAAIELIAEDQREDAMPELPTGVAQSTVPTG